ncbi:hypothetical protein PR001_g17680 [Phytophthora rubi]|uniref:Uncharacterized protein n=1 Tax=Phytophthora rubi TaxID=129364 RepID=A0A6A3KAA9_9STRA|nr:hypothetical protein PR001_g17680 [Phytophthora rubi]
MFAGVKPLANQVVKLFHLTFYMAMELTKAPVHKEAAVGGMPSLATLLAIEPLPTPEIRVSVRSAMRTALLAVPVETRSVFLRLAISRGVAWASRVLCVRRIHSRRRLWLIARSRHVCSPSDPESSGSDPYSDLVSATWIARTALV